MIIPGQSLRRPLSTIAIRWKCRAAVTAALALGVLLLWPGVAPGQVSGQSSQPEDQPGSTISGTVINSVTHEPINRALVYSPDNRFATFTDDRGHFEFNLPQSESASPAMGSAPLNRPANLLAKKPGYLDDRRAPAYIGPNQKELTIALTPESLIVGRVIFPTPDAAERVQVVLYNRQVQEGIARWVQRKQITARSDGEFRFAGLEAGAYKVFTMESLDRDPLTTAPNGQVYGFPPAYFPAARDFGTAGVIELDAAKTVTANLTPVRQAYYQVKIPVVNTQPGADMGMQVFVFAQGHRGPGFDLGFNSQEQDIEGLLPDGTYYVEASSFGPTTATGVTSITVRGAALQAPPMTLVPNGSIPVEIHQEFSASEPTPSQGGVITGVQAPPGQLQGPQAYTTLQPADDFGPEHPTAMDQQHPGNDTATIPAVVPGRYWVRVDAPHGYAASITSGGKDLLHEPLVVTFGGSSSPIEITLRDNGAEIDGTVEGLPNSYSPAGNSARVVMGPLNGSPTSGLPFNLYVYCVPLPDSPGRFTEFASVAPDGSFQIQQMPPGAYRVMAFDRPQQIEYRNPEAMRAYDSKGQVIRLAPGQKEKVRLQLITSE